MPVENTTKKTLIAKNAKICRGIVSKSLGLMFSKPRPLIFIFKKEKIVPLHMLFVFYPIDVLFLDKNKKVVEVKESFKPFKFYTPKNKALYIIELPKGAIKNSKTKIGDKISF
ncbi:DUF192 domain-containing protein [Candidatus Woesearchaeota archaeon]|nr:DUF192 domain-containing protein [Candidatus Woesearchaeota archaeon]